MSKERKKIVAKLDKVFSKYIRARDAIMYKGVCPFCHKRPIECCFHFMSRIAYATRWREDNAIGSCMSCNMQNEHEPTPFILWFIDHFGREKLDYLQALYHSVATYTDNELKLIIGEYKKRLDSLTLPTL